MTPQPLPDGFSNAEVLTRTRARAWPASPLELEVAFADISSLRRLARALRSVGRKRQWRRLVQLRTSFIAASLRAIARAAQHRFAGRSRDGDGVWAVFATEADDTVVLAARFCPPKVRTPKDFAAPMPVEIVRPDLFDVQRLEQWVSRFPPPSVESSETTP